MRIQAYFQQSKQTGSRRRTLANMACVTHHTPGSVNLWEVFMSRQELAQWLQYLDGRGLEVNDWDMIESELQELPADEVVIG